MSDNVNKVRNLIKYIIINFPNQLEWFSMSRSCSNIKLSFLTTEVKNKCLKTPLDWSAGCSDL